MSVFKDLQPFGVLKQFEALCRIPHGSGHTKAVSDHCMKFAEELGLEAWQDEANNVVIVKEASRGYEDAPTVILQGHLDMVLEKTAECTKDLLTEGLDLRTDGAFVWAEGTTLGGDNGIAVAMALAVLEDDTIVHPRLEVVLTTDEEIGMLGAVALDCNCLQGRKMLNLDSEMEGVFTVSCAGGVRAGCVIPVDRMAFSGTLCTLEVSGLQGGHSGIEIHKGRANANVLMTRLLWELSQQVPVSLVELKGGLADNAICRQTKAAVLVPEEEEETVRQIVAQCLATFRQEYRVTEPELSVTVQAVPGQTVRGLSLSAADRAISALMALPNGVQSMSMEIEGLVQTSLNLGILRLSQELLTADFAVRSALGSEKELLCSRLDCICRLADGEVSFTGDYPAWEYEPQSTVRSLVTDVYKTQTGKEPVIEAIHAGLECGVFAGKLPGLDCLSLGPNLLDIHTPQERMELASVHRTWELLLEVLRRSKEL